MAEMAKIGKRDFPQDVMNEGATYAIVPNIEHPELSAVDLLVWGALCSFAHWEWAEDKRPVLGHCNPGRSKLAKKALCGLRTVARSIKTLEELGFLQHKQTKCGDGLGAERVCSNSGPTQH